MNDLSNKSEVYLNVMRHFSEEVGYQNAGNALFFREIIEIMTDYLLLDREKIDRVNNEIMARAQAELTIKRN